MNFNSNPTQSFVRHLFQTPKEFILKFLNSVLTIIFLVTISNLTHAQENPFPAPSPTTNPAATNVNQSPPLPPPNQIPFHQPINRPLYRPTKNNLNFRLLANYDYIMTNPNDLNTYGSNTSWGGTTKAQGDFSNMNGYSLGGGYLIGNGYLGVEYAYGMQDLPTTNIIATTNTIQYTFDYQTIYVLYDWTFNFGINQSYEFGGGIGYAIAYQYHWVYKTNSVLEEVIWQAHPSPILFKVRASYSYHFSENLRLRAGATYEYITSSNILADTTHSGLIVNGSGIIANQNLKSASGQNVTIDMSGLRLSVGLVAAF